MKDEDITRGVRADALLKDPLLIEAQEVIEKEFWRLFKDLQPTDTEGLAQLKGMQYLHEKYLSFLKSVVNQGKLAKLELDRTRPRPAGY
jgi:hypothetical protein